MSQEKRMSNRATIYSNGVADFRRIVRVAPDSEARVTIPVRSEHTADVLGSLSILGRVRFNKPPMFRPRAAQSDALEFDPKDALRSLVLGLVGARVEVEHGGKLFAGRVVGLQRDERFCEQQKLVEQALVIEDPSGLHKLALRELGGLRFVDAHVQAELDKTLLQRIESIKPNATFVEFTLVAVDDGARDAVVQYSVPAAAWKISYRLRAPGRASLDAAAETSEVSAPWSLQAFAVVDNNTDEDWEDMLFSVVTGEPITFASDLAEAKTPLRERVEVVADRALGAVELASGMPALGAAAVVAGGPGEASAPASRRGRKHKVAASFGATEMEDFAFEALEAPAPHEVAAAREVADFCVFECSEPVSIPAQRSAVLPVLDAQLDDAKAVFVYKHEDHDERPFRAVEFVYAGPQSLGRGVCSVFDADTFVGSAVLGPAKSGERVLLPHALETGIRVRRDGPDQRRELARLRVARGVVELHERSTATTRYTVMSLRDEPSSLVIDHSCAFQPASDRDRPEVEVVYPDGERSKLEVSERLASGYRLRCEVPARASLELVIDEQRVDGQAVELVAETGDELRFDWLWSSYVKTDGVLADRPEIQALVELQASVDEAQLVMDRAHEEQERLVQRAERLRSNITSVGSGDPATARWTQDLQALEDRLLALEDESIPAQRDRQRAARDALRAALRALSLEWTQA